MIVDKLISVHFPKAAGSSLRAQLVAHLPDKFEEDYTHDPLGKYGQETAEFPAEKRIVHGHFRPDRYLNTDVFLATFLREPVENLVSIYYFWITCGEHGNPVHTRFLSERPSIFEFARHAPFSALMSEVYFGNFDMNKFNFIGFHERRDIDIPKLGSILGIPLQSNVHENLGPLNVQRDEILKTASKLNILRDNLKKDVLFYETLLDKYH